MLFNIHVIAMIEIIQKESFLKSNFLKVSSLALGACLAFFFCSPALAEVDLDTEIQKITDVATSLEGVVTGFTTILVGTGGITAAFQVFRRVLLQNV